MQAHAFVSLICRLIFRDDNNTAAGRKFVALLHPCKVPAENPLPAAAGRKFVALLHPCKVPAENPLPAALGKEFNTKKLVA